MLSTESVLFVTAVAVASSRYGLAFCIAITIERVVAGRGSYYCWKGRIRSMASASLVVAATEEEESEPD